MTIHQPCLWPLAVMHTLAGFILQEIIMYYLGKTSRKRLAGCHERLQLLVEEAIKTSPLDFGVVCGFRGRAGQEAAFDTGKSRARWGQSLHNYRIGANPCALAVDLAPYSAELRDYLWSDVNAFCRLHNHIRTTAHLICLKIRWGGHFRHIKDLPHFEVVI